MLSAFSKWVGTVAMAAVVTFLAGSFFFKSYFLVRNESDREIRSIEMIITYGTNTPAARKVSKPVGNLGPKAELKHRFSTSDASLGIAFIDGQTRREVYCGYVSSMMADYIVTIPQSEKPTCRAVTAQDR